jgi:hypothetical protein
MTMPSGMWRNKFNNQSTKVKVPDYTKALQADTERLMIFEQVRIWVFKETTTYIEIAWLCSLVTTGCLAMIGSIHNSDRAKQF